MKRVLNDLTPLPGNDLFITQYWFDKQTDPPLHFHEDYMLSLTLNVHVSPDNRSTISRKKT